MIAAVPLALAVSLAPAAPSDVPDFVEVATTRFAPSLEGLGQGQGNLAAHPDRPFAYALSYDTLFVIDTTAGDVVETRSLADLYGEGFRFAGALDVAGSGSSALLVLGPFYGHDALEVFSLADPRDPVRIGSIPARPYDDWKILTDGRSVVLNDGRNAAVWDLLAGAKLGDFEKATGPYVEIDDVIGAGGPPGGATVALIERRYVSGQELRALVLHDVGPGGGTALRAWADLPARPTALLVDREARIVVVGYESGPSGPHSYEIRDADTAQVLSTIAAHAGAWVAALVEGGGVRVLAAADTSGIDLFDVADPAAPAALPRVASRLGYDLNGYLDASRTLAPSATAPLLFAASPGERAILAIDVRDGSVVGRSATASLPPVSIALSESGSRRDGVALVYRTEFNEVLAPGGRREVQVHDLSDPDAPALVARVRRSEPARIVGFVALGASHAVAADPQSEAYALVDLREGRVVEVTGPLRIVGEAFSSGDGTWLRSAGRFLLAVGPDGWQEWALVAGRLVPVSGGGDDPRESFGAGEVHGSGRVVVLGYDNAGYFLMVRDLDGRSGRLPLEGRGFPTMTLSPDGGRALLDGQTLIDVSDPEHPTIAWRSEAGGVTARFDPTGAAILVTQGYAGSYFTARRIDASTGVPLTESSDPIDKFYYHGDGTAYGSGSGWRAVFWRWTWDGSETVLLDAAASPPRLLRAYPEVIEAFQSYAPRETGGWYEILWNPWDGFSDFLVADASGEQRHVLRDPRVHVLPASVGGGCVATAADPDGLHPEVVLWRDTSLGHPEPVTLPRAPGLRIGPR